MSRDDEPRIFHKDPEAVSRLSAEQYNVTQLGATEPAFKNVYWNAKRAGLYVDVVSGEPLFASTDKYDSDTGWPSFTTPVEPANVHYVADRSYGMIRTEVRSAHGDSHLGHVFEDGPPEAGGRRYCLNSAALRFIPLADLQAEGYGQYVDLFDDGHAERH
jgi:peptide-methionine (R)-S-oxide reductase